MQIQEILKSKTFQKTEKKIDSWKLQAEEMSKFFGKPIYFLFWRYDRQKLYEAYRVCEEKRIASIKYLIGILRK